MARPLTAKQELFCREYLVDLNATQAATRAGYSPRTANEQGARLLANVSVAARVAELQAERAARVGVTADDVVRELTRIAFLDPRQLMSWGGDGGVKFLPSDQLPEDVARCVSECSETITEGGGTVRVRVASKLDALDKLARHLGMYRDKVDVTHSGQVAQVHVYVPANGRDAPAPP